MRDQLENIAAAACVLLVLVGLVGGSVSCLLLGNPW